MPRRGVTLLELAVVLTIMGVAAALVTPVFASRLAETTPREDVIAGARRRAIQRGEPLRLRVLATGDWALAAARDGAVIDSGAFSASSGDSTSAPTEREMDVLIDALGGCVPARQSSIRSRASATELPVASFDPLTCREHRGERNR